MRHLAISIFCVFIIFTIYSQESGVIKKNDIFFTLDSLEVVDEILLEKIKVFIKKNKEKLDSSNCLSIMVRSCCFENNRLCIGILIEQNTDDILRTSNFLGNKPSFFKVDDIVVLASKSEFNSSFFRITENKKTFIFEDNDRIYLIAGFSSPSVGYVINIKNDLNRKYKRYSYIDYPFTRLQLKYYKFRNRFFWFYCL
jgi:hypothetical protein